MAWPQLWWLDDDGVLVSVDGLALALARDDTALVLVAPSSDGDESGSPTSGRLISMNDRLLQHRYDAPLDSLVG